MFSSRLLTGLSLLLLLLLGCTQPPESCPSSMPTGTSSADAIARNDSLPFRFPLDQSSIDETPQLGIFGLSSGGPVPERSYHAAEDFLRPAGTPVYAMADGRVSFSGPMGGYGWLIIIDHPQVNLYSLYGHLSPSRWRKETGRVKRGELIAYLGDAYENGGSQEHPLVPHLHFGTRTGQRADYPARGEWRWQAGWIKLCPQDLGWLQPSIIINQDIPSGGYPEPAPDFLALWGFELLITGSYLSSGIGILVHAIRKNKRFFLFFPGAVLTAAGVVLYNNGLVWTHTLAIGGILLLFFGTLWHFRRSIVKPFAQS